MTKMSKKEIAETLPYGGTNQVIINEDGEISNTIYANSEGVICNWMTRGYKPQTQGDEFPEWLYKFLDKDGALKGSWE